MEAILKVFDDERRSVGGSVRERKKQSVLAKQRPPSAAERESISASLEALARALRDALPSLEGGETKTPEGDASGNASDVRWLLKTLRPLASDDDHLSLIARLVWDACQSKDQSQQEEALFAALGASEEAMAALFEIVPRIPDLRREITAESLRDAGIAGGGSRTGGAADGSGGGFESTTTEDPAEAERRRLRQEAYEAAQIAAIAKAEAEAVTGRTSAHATHTVVRQSEKALIKAAQKAQKQANQALQRAKAAGAILDESDLAFAPGGAAAEQGLGGLMNRSEDELRAIQAALQPEGTRMRHTDGTLPSGTIREDDDVIGYEKVTIPPPRLDPGSLHERLKLDDIFVNANEMDCKRAFAGTKSLNPMQSTVFETAFRRRENVLVCAPTGAGKTNVALLCVTAHFRDVGLIGNTGDDDYDYDSDGDSYGDEHDDGAVNKNKNNNSSSGGILETGQKVVYIAPMKALAQEVVEKFSSKLKPLGLIVRELTGDIQLTRAEAQSANVIVTTPEKWDVVTRKSGADDNSLGNQCGLLIIDEVHLLADDRGAVIESVVARLHRLVETRQKQQRIVGLSATLPNYKDVAEFLQVPERGLFYFGPEFRPVPMQQTFVGVTGNVKNRFLMNSKMDDVCYEMVKDSLARGYQVMVFVHSRKGTGDAASALAQRAQAAGELERFFTTQGKENGGAEAYKRYADRAKKSRNREVTNHFYNGMGIHHAGMLRGDRKLTESMFADGAIKVLCCTATLAWGINLPAHTVVVKGTDIYNPEKGKMVDLSILDVQQIFGRAGRPQYDISGEANLITTHQALNRYLDKLVRAVPIESTFIKQLADHLNAEIVGGTVTNLQEAVNWLSYTYLYVRMLKNPLAYGINADQKADDPSLRGRLLELVREAATTLSQEKMISFHPPTGNLSMTTLGRVAAHFYIQAESVATFNDQMEINPYPNDIDVLHMVSSANEFENLRVRQEEQKELDSLQGKCPLTLEGPVNDSATKAFVLMQAFISSERPKGFTLISDTNYIASNAGRVARAIFEMCLHGNKAGTALKLLRFAKSIDNQFWWFQSPLRHFQSEIGMNSIKALESRHLGVGRNRYDSLSSTLDLLEMTPEEVGQIVRSKKATGAKIQRFVGMIPKPIISCNVQPVTNSVLKFQIEISPDFEWQGRWHGGAVFFWLWIEDAQSERIYHQEQVMFTKKTYPESVNLEMYIPTFATSAQYLVRLVSDSWVGVEVVHPVSLEQTRMPEQVVTNTDLMDLTPLPTTVLQNEKYEQLFSRIDTFNPVQTQLFHVLYHTDLPVLLGAPTGSGKTVVGELTILRMKRLHKNGICVYIAPLKSLARERLKEWGKRFGGAPMHWKILELSGDTHHDRRALECADILVCTPEKWDLISRGWRGSGDEKSSSDDNNRRSFVKRVRLLVIDEIHLLGEERGAVLEAIVSRTRFISRSLQQNQGSNRSTNDPEMIRIVGLSTAVANPLDLADWMGIDTTKKIGMYNFRPSIRPVPTYIHIQGYPGKHYCPRMATMNKPCYAAIKQHSPDRPSLIFVASRRQTRLTAFDLISFAAGDQDPKVFLGCDDAYIDGIAASIQDEALRHTITFGIGLHHAGLSSGDRDIVERLYLSGEIRVLVATATLAWGVNLPARLVIVKGTEYFDGKVSRYVDYPLTDVLQMIGRAGRPGFDTEGTAVVLCESSKKNFYKKFLYTPFPVESCLRDRLCENLNAEIATGTVNSKLDAVGYLIWTFFARRVKANPSYYGAKSSSSEHVEEFLTSVANETLEKLEKEGCIERDDNDAVIASTLGKSTSEFYLNHRTAKQMQFGLRQCAKIILSENPAVDDIDDRTPTLRPLKRTGRLEEVSIAWLLYTLCCTHEFDELPVRHNEEYLNEDLSKDVMWGPDTSAVLSKDGRAGYVDDEVYADSHTKGFLLVQAHLERVKLPISDYINDSKTVMDSVPRLLAAMQFIAAREGGTDGSFDVLCQLVRTKQLISTRTTPRMNPGTQLVGVNESSFNIIMNRINSKKKKGQSNSEKKRENTVWKLRRTPLKEVGEAIRNCRKGTFRAPPHKILTSLQVMPLITLKEGKVYHEIDKATGKSIGTLKVALQIEREKPHKDDFTTLSLVLGSFESQKLLACSEVAVSRNGTWTVEKQLQFDWKTANADGGEDGGRVVLRLLLDSIRGLDSEIVFPIT